MVGHENGKRSSLSRFTADRREPLPECYGALKRKLAGLLPIMREHGFAEPSADL